MAPLERILLINYDFPPAWSGTRRIVKFARYLQDEGFDPIVLAAQPSIAQSGDFETLEEVNAHPYEVIRTPSLDAYHLADYAKQVFRRGKHDSELATTKPSEPSVAARRLMAWQRRFMGWPDDRLPWLLHAIPVAEALLKRRAIRYVLTSSYPNCTHLIGRSLKQKFRFHWHADFRDGWTQNPYFGGYNFPGQKAWNLRAERDVARGTDTLSAVCEPITQHLQTLTDPAKAQTIPNGFDVNDLKDLPHPLKDDRFTIVYTGTFMGHRQPDHFLLALRELFDSNPGIQTEIRTIFCCNVRQEHRKMVQDLRLENVVEFRPLVTYRHSLALQKAADLLLVIEGEAQHAEIMLTQKIFEYLMAGPPVLAMCPGGVLADLVHRTQAGMVVAPDNVFAIKELVLDFFLGRTELNRNTRMIEPYSRQNQARQLATMLRTHK